MGSGVGLGGSGVRGLAPSVDVYLHTLHATPYSMSFEFKNPSYKNACRLASAILQRTRSGLARAIQRRKDLDLFKNAYKASQAGSENVRYALIIPQCISMYLMHYSMRRG